MKRTLSLILAFILVFTAILGMIPTSAAETATGKLKITKANLEFASTVYLLIAVDYTDVYATAEEAMAGVSITVDGERLTPDASVPAPEGSVGFKYKELSAKEMGNEIIIEAFAGDSAEADDFVSYSILEYTIKAREAEADDDYLMNVIDRLLEFGAAAQEAFLPEGESIATAYDYDLAKNHSIAKLVGAVNPKTGDDKVILEEGRAIDVTSTDNSAKASGVFFYNNSVEYRAQSAAGSLTAGIEYIGKSETLFTAPTDKAIFMDSYTGPTLYYYGYGEDNTAAYSDKNLNTQSNPIPAFNPINFGQKLTEEPTALNQITGLKGSGTINPGYIMIRGTMYPNVKSDAIGGRISRFVAQGYDKFTLSYTMATTDNNTPKSEFGYMAFRVTNATVIDASSSTDKKATGRLNLLQVEYDKGGIIRAGANADATSSSAAKALQLFTPSQDNVLNGTNSVNNYSDFFTVNMVITLAGDNEYGTIDYYIDGTHVGTIRHYASDEYFAKSGVYLMIYLAGSNTGYRSAFKNIVVTPGDIVNDYN